MNAGPLEVSCGAKRVLWFMGQDLHGLGLFQCIYQMSLEFIIKGFGIFSRLHCLFGQFLLRGGARGDHSLGEC